MGFANLARNLAVDAPKVSVLGSELDLTFRFSTSFLAMKFGPISLAGIAVLLLTMPGCSILIHHSGMEVDDPDTREGVRSQFGVPDSVTQTTRLDPISEKRRTFDVENYHIHAKFRTTLGSGPVPPWYLFLDPFMTCYELYEAAREHVRGHDLAFVYDENGKTIGHQYPIPSTFGLVTLSGTHEDNVLTWPEHTPDGEASSVPLAPVESATRSH